MFVQTRTDLTRSKYDVHGPRMRTAPFFLITPALIILALSAPYRARTQFAQKWTF